MNQEIFKLMSLLPGLYYQKERIEEEIRNIEILISNNGVKPKISKKREPTKKEKQNYRNASNGMKKYWASLTPEQREAKKRKMRLGLRKVLKVKKAAKAA